MSELNHEQAKQALLREADGLLDAEQAAGLQRHLAGCADCRHEQAELRGLEESLRETFREHSQSRAMPPLARGRVLAGGAALSRVTREQRMILAAAMLALVLLAWTVGVGVWAGWPPDQALRIDKTRPATQPSSVPTLAVMAPSPTPTFEPLVMDGQEKAVIMGRLIVATPGPKDG
ncbi:MAG: zf-HC2 domain-containing protein [Anaerolineaceae bacterium]|nr:zf-HC2 domain-containing protein [Anaerolineaceae bacterium]